MEAYRRKQPGGRRRLAGWRSAQAAGELARGDGVWGGSRRRGEREDFGF